MNREVNLTKRVRTANGMRFCPVVLSAMAASSPPSFWSTAKPKPRHSTHGVWEERYGDKFL
jgi:hypothetical protein